MTPGGNNSTLDLMCLENLEIYPGIFSTKRKSAVSDNPRIIKRDKAS